MGFFFLKAIIFKLQWLHCRFIHLLFNIFHPFNGVIHKYWFWLISNMFPQFLTDLIAAITELPSWSAAVRLLIVETADRRMKERNPSDNRLSVKTERENFFVKLAIKLCKYSRRPWLMENEREHRFTTIDLTTSQPLTEGCAVVPGNFSIQV